jgi:hypothetical protein
MKLKLQARHLWEAVEYPDIAEYGEDRSALDAICSAVPEDMVAVLATKDTAHDAWEAIKTLRIGDDRVRRSTAQTLRAEYESIALRPGEAIEEFALRLTNITQRIDIHYHFIRECVEEDRVKLQSIATTEQLADILTKALGRELFCENSATTEQLADILTKARVLIS